MSAPRDQSAYWNAAATKKSFAHPFDAALFATVVAPGARVLDCGCGYGRTMREIDAGGWRAVGVDPAEGMLARARSENASMRLVRAAPGTLPFTDAAFDAAALMAVLTCIPGDDAQIALIDELRRVVRPGGALYVSDLYVNSDERNIARYEAARRRGFVHGVFELPEGAVLRHHDPAWIARLFADWETIESTEFTAVTMNGHTSRAFRLLLRRVSG